MELKSPEFSQSPMLMVATPLSQNYIVAAGDRPAEAMLTANATMNVMALKHELIQDSNQKHFNRKKSRSKARDIVSVNPQHAMSASCAQVRPQSLTNSVMLSHREIAE